MWGRGRAAVVIALLASGCAQNNNSSGFLASLPWNRPAPAATGAAAPTASAASPAASPTSNPTLLSWLNLDPQTRAAYIKDLEQRAGTQANLASQQAQDLNQLKLAQESAEKSYAQQLADLKRQQSLADQEMLKRERLVAEQQQDSLRRLEEARQHAELLDRDNRELNTRLAQASQRTQVLEDQVDLLQQRLEESTAQLADARHSSQRAAERLSAVQASTQRRSPATITANNSVLDRLTAVSVPGVDIRQDFDQVRIALPSDELFLPGTATLREGAAAVLGQAAEVILKYYPQQIIGVEAHTDGAMPPGSLWRSEHQLSAAQAMTVFDQLTQQYRLAPRQLFVLGHGSNHPRQRTPGSGFEAINRRVELVVYPERYGQRQP